LNYYFSFKRIEQKAVNIQLNNTLANLNIEKIKNSTSKANQKCSELTKVLITVFYLF